MGPINDDPVPHPLKAGWPLNRCETFCDRLGRAFQTRSLDGGDGHCGIPELVDSRQCHGNVDRSLNETDRSRDRSGLRAEHLGSVSLLR